MTGKMSVQECTVSPGLQGPANKERSNVSNHQREEEKEEGIYLSSSSSKLLHLLP